MRDVAAHHSILVLGDSLAQGYGASDAAHGFAFLVYRRILANDPTAQITDYAIAGTKVSDVIADELPRAQSMGASDVWLCVGANDVTHDTPAEQYATDMKRLVSAIRARWPAARIVVFGIPDVSRSPLFTGVARFTIQRLAQADNDAARQAAGDTGADFVDLYAFSRRALDITRDLGPDNFHPNDQGYEAIAGFTARTLGYL